MSELEPPPGEASWFLVDAILTPADVIRQVLLAGPLLLLYLLGVGVAFLVNPRTPVDRDLPTPAPPRHVQGPSAGLLQSDAHVRSSTARRTARGSSRRASPTEKLRGEGRSMAMTHEEFEALVARLESDAEAHPRAYRMRAAGLGLLAYVYVFGVLVLAIALIGLLVAVLFVGDHVRAGVAKLVLKGGWALGALVVAVGRAMWVKLEQPGGIRLERDAHPDLFATIDDVRKRVGAPAPDVVFLDDSFNAGIVQRPRFGLIGGTRSYLFLGLPLLRALTPERLRAVLAHEFGHLAGRHGRWGNFIYRSRLRWSAVLSKLEEDNHWASFVFRPFFRWYAPFFNAYSFVQARIQEYDADRQAADAESPRAMGEALMDLHLRGAELDERFWGGVRRRMDEVAEPDVRPFSQMRFEGVDEATARCWLDHALAEETTVADTHPCLRERLAALGVEPRVPEPDGVSAAEVLLGAKLPELSARFDEAWLEWITPQWREHYEGLAEQRERLAELDAKAGARSVDEDWEHACLVEELRGPDEALAAYQALHARAPDHVSAEFTVGRLLLDRDDPAGLEHIERMIGASDTAILPGSQHAVGFLRRAGRDAEAERWIERARAHQAKLEAAEHERSTVFIDDRWDPHGLPPEDLAPLLSELREDGEVKEAWLLRRRLEHYPEHALYTLVIRRKSHWTDGLSNDKEKKRDLALQERMQGASMPEGFIVVTNHRPRKHRNKLEGVEGSRIFPPAG